MKQQTILFRQGDVLLERVAQLPGEYETWRATNNPAYFTQIQPRHDSLILAEGEATGHAHRIPASDAALLGFMPNGDFSRIDHFIEVLRPTHLLHEEHRAIPLAPGLYRLRPQREYSESGDIWVND